MSLPSSSPRASTIIGLKYSRAAGMGLGIFLLIWGPLSYWRWVGQPAFALIEGTIMMGLGSLLALPWGRGVGAQLWSCYFVALMSFTMAFVFVQVFDTLFQYRLAAEFKMKPFPAVFQGIWIFIALMQPPTILFLRKPHLLA